MELALSEIALLNQQIIRALNPKCFTTIRMNVKIIEDQFLDVT